MLNKKRKKINRKQNTVIVALDRVPGRLSVVCYSPQHECRYTSLYNTPNHRKKADGKWSQAGSPGSLIPLWFNGSTEGCVGVVVPRELSRECNTRAS